jgi:hypothetical protein
LRGDDFEGFFAERTRVLLGKLYSAMGKKGWSRSRVMASPQSTLKTAVA